MSYFINNVVYVIVPVADITEEMFNNVKLDFNTNGNISSNGLKKNTLGDKVLFKLLKPISNVFVPYTWFNRADALVILRDGTWG